MIITIIVTILMMIIVIITFFPFHSSAIMHLLPFELSNVLQPLFVEVFTKKKVFYTNAASVC